MDSNSSLQKVRLDKWLWAARFFKTRSLAAEAVDGGKIQVNGDRAKRARMIQQGDTVRIRNGPYEYMISVKDVSERRGPATEAALLYEESAESIKAREETQAHVRAMRVSSPHAEGKPTKKDRRDMERARRRF